MDSISRKSAVHTAPTTRTAQPTKAAEVSSEPSESFVPSQAAAPAKNEPGAPCGDMVTTKSGLQYGIISPGSGDPVKPGQLAQVNYTGWLENGKKFDSSLDPGRQPFAFQVGAHGVIAGWDEGVAGMQIGEQRKLIVPSDLGYGAAGAGGVIPPNATLVFDVQLLADKNPGT
jgi:FKBP-type peptidyl-prolyl cis-trans isomerase